LGWSAVSQWGLSPGQELLELLRSAPSLCLPAVWDIPAGPHHPPSCPGAVGPSPPLCTAGFRGGHNQLKHGPRPVRLTPPAVPLRGRRAGPGQHPEGSETTGLSRGQGGREAELCSGRPCRAAQPRGAELPGQALLSAGLWPPYAEPVAFAPGERCPPSQRGPSPGAAGLLAPTLVRGKWSCQQPAPGPTAARLAGFALIRAPAPRAVSILRTEVLRAPRKSLDIRLREDKTPETER